MNKKSKKDKKPRPQPKPNRQIPISMIKTMQLYGPRYYLQHAREYPILGCWIMDGWFDEGITPVVVAREQEPGKVLYANYMVDLTCLGIKDVFTKTDVPLSNFESSLPELCSGKPIKCSVELAHEVIYGALEYAEHYGFQPHPDFKAMIADQVIDPADTHPRVDNVAFGRDGKPYYISGPYDDQRRQKFILDTLTRTAGVGNFNYVINLGRGMPDLMDDDVF